MKENEPSARPPIPRREFLQLGLGITAATVVSGLDASPDWAATSRAPRRMGGRVVRPDDSDYDAARQGYNARIARYPGSIVFCRDAGDVARTLRSARASGTPFRARCGRHSYEGYSLVDDGVVIDVSLMNGLWLDKARQIVHVGAGVRLLDLYETLWHEKVTVPGGSCATVGISGLTLGGGYGLLSRHLGLTCDSLVGVEIVTANGRVRHADSRHFADLLWASQGGGGGNFGIVTSLAFCVHPVDQVSIYNISWDESDLEAVLRVWQAWAPSADDRLTSVLKLRARKKGMISSIGQFVGPPGALAALLRPLAMAGTPQGVSIESVSYIKAVRIFAGLKPDYRRWQMHAPSSSAIAASQHTLFKGSSDFADRALTADAIATIRRFLQSAPGDGDLVQLDSYGGAIGRISSEATAFPHRANTLFGLQYQAYWNRSTPDALGLAWVRDFRKAMQPYVSGRAYVNYCDADLGTDAPRAYYAGNLPRLMRIKRKYDPHNVFQFPQSVPLPGQSEYVV